MMASSAPARWRVNRRRCTQYLRVDCLHVARVERIVGVYPIPSFPAGLIPLDVSLLEQRQPKASVCPLPRIVESARRRGGQQGVYRNVIRFVLPGGVLIIESHGPCVLCPYPAVVDKRVFDRHRVAFGQTAQGRNQVAVRHLALFHVPNRRDILCRVGAVAVKRPGNQGIAAAQSSPVAGTSVPSNHFPIKVVRTVARSAAG